MAVDQFRVAHWMNARKYTAQQVAELAGITTEQMTALISDAAGSIPDTVVTAVATALRVDPGQLTASGERDLTVLVHSGDELRRTVRPIQRDGIHFYNYYTMAAPPGRVAPVILDILCPADRLPALNNGHLEPAITVNLGPGDIHGRWGEEIGPDTWQVLQANGGGDGWIVGDSYVEPSYRPHSYSLASSRPARIVSYTGQSNIAALVAEFNSWSAPAFDNFVELLEEGLPPATVLDALLARRGHDRATAAATTGVTVEAIDRIADEPFQAVDTARTLGRTLGFDYRLLLPPERRHDPVGKTWASLADARRSIRSFGGYQVASMASAPHLTDLIGSYLRVDGPGADLVELADSHYLVVAGNPELSWTDTDGKEHRAKLGPDSSAWAGPFVRHRWGGQGAVLKFGSGDRAGYLDLFELTNTHAPAATARRGRRDVRGWGYES